MKPKILFRLIPNSLILCLVMLSFSGSANAQNASSTYSFENFEPTYELNFGDNNITKKLIVGYSGLEKKVNGSVKGNPKVLKASGLKKVSDKRYYFTLDINSKEGVGDFKYKVDLSDYNPQSGQTSSSTMQANFNVKVNGLTFDKVTPPLLTKTYTDYSIELPFKFKNKVPIYFTVDKPDGFNAYPIQYYDYNARTIQLRFYVETLKDYNVTIKAKTFDKTIEVGKINIKISPSAEKLKVVSSNIKVKVKSEISTISTPTSTATTSKVNKNIQKAEPQKPILSKILKFSNPKNPKPTSVEKDIEEIDSNNNQDNIPIHNIPKPIIPNLENRQPFYQRIFDWFLL